MALVTALDSAHHVVMRANIDPADLRFDTSRWEAAASRLRAMDAEMAETTLESVRSAESMEDLMEHYDFGEPAENGSLIAIASSLLSEPPTDIVIETYEELAIIDEDYGRRFHHGNVSVDGAFGAFDNIWITGDLRVRGALTAGHLDAFPDLLVAGDLKAAAMTFSGLTFVGGALSADTFVRMEDQGEVILRGSLSTPLLLDHGDGSEFPLGNVGRCIDLNEATLKSLAEALGVSLNADDDEFDLVHRALERCS